MGLNSTWDDSNSANDKTPSISSAWGSYADLPARGVNLGGWLSLEPFITPSLFNYDSKLGIIDEWTLCTHLGASGAKSTLEKHYATFVSEQTFIDIANAGLDHVRIPFSYWAVVTYDQDPYVFRTSWRYLLRGIEWARKYGLRISLDVHGLPGSQNGWNHSGRQGAIGWLNGTDGSLNAQRSLDIHDQLSKFFAQDRYKNIIAFYGLVNEPKMTALKTSDVLTWTSSAYSKVRANGVSAFIVFGDGFEGLANWKGQLQDQSGLVLDVHQYVIFNSGQIVYNHTAKVDYACNGWSQQAEKSMNTATGFGPTIFMEWSQADTDCASNLNNVGIGNRWTGTFNSGDPATQVLSPDCPTTNSQCSCTNANAPGSSYSSDYKQFLQMFAEAQMSSFEQGWGWFYWTWVTEDATQWSYQLGLAAGILPKKAYDRDFNCTGSIPSFSGLPEYY
jgi:glucan 1,3-beta-glucosidase